MKLQFFSLTPSVPVFSIKLRVPLLRVRLLRCRKVLCEDAARLKTVSPRSARAPLGGERRCIQPRSAVAGCAC